MFADQRRLPRSSTIPAFGAVVGVGGFFLRLVRGNGWTLLAAIGQAEGQKQNQCEE